MKIISTIGPSCSSSDILQALKSAGVDVFRINLSHASLDDIEVYWKIGSDLGLRIAIDTEGAQIRTGGDAIYPLQLESGSNISLSGPSSPISPTSSSSNSTHLFLTPSYVIDLLRPGDLLRLDFNGALIQVKTCQPDLISCVCVSSGTVGLNKGVDILNRSVDLNDFSSKDIEALRIASDLGIKDVFISFCKSSSAVDFVRSSITDCHVTSKIESRSSIHSLHSICASSDAILIDRGDLSREISILDIPFAQRGIISMANKLNTPCYVATNVLESLVDGVLPTRAELNDIVSTLEMGAAGIVLAAETAIGAKPLLCVEIVKELMHKYNLYSASLLFGDLDRNEITDPLMKLWLNRSSNYQ